MMRNDLHRRRPSRDRGGFIIAGIFLGWVAICLGVVGFVLYLAWKLVTHITG